MGREVLYKKFAEKGFKIGAEVGVQAGINALDMFKNIPGLRLYLIDPWENRRAYKRTVKKVSPYNAIIIQKKSNEAALEIPDNHLDFVYIDGDHSYDGVMLDIILWSKKVKDGGIVSGHDYRRTKKLEVKPAVDNYARFHRKKLELSEGRNWFWET